jgi:hypothetical protein
VLPPSHFVENNNNGNTPHNDRESPKAQTTKLILETELMAEVMTLGMVKTFGIR